MRVGGRAREGRSRIRLRPPRNQLFAAALGGVAALAIAAPQAAAQADCVKRDVVLASNAHARVVGDSADCDEREGPAYFDVRAGLRGGKLRSLDYQGEDIITVHSFELRGRYLAYVSTWHEGEEQGSDYNVMNVRTGAIHQLDSVWHDGPEPWGSYVLKPNGSSAWIVDEAWGDEFAERPIVVVRSCPRERCLRAKRRTLTLDDSRGIAMNSLRLRGSRLTWTRGGALRRATLR